MSPEQWLQPTRSGLYCPPANTYIDAMRPVATSIVTHGHADHARPGHGRVIATPATLDIMRVRYGKDHAQECIPLDYGQELPLDGGVSLRLEPAGHILGSAQAILTHQGQKVVISGDYKRTPDPTCLPFKPETCDVFITEATFALPVFKHPPIQDEISKLLHSLQLFPERCHLVGVYALGKCQRVMLGLRELGYHNTLYLHGALVQLCKLYQQHGIDLGDWQVITPETDRKQLAGEIVLAPPSALADRWSRRLPDVVTAMASGWMQIRARSKQRRAELPLIISDHSDWHELLQTAQEVNAPEVWVTHGREEALVHQLQTMGFKAKPLSLVGYEEEAS